MSIRPRLITRIPYLALLVGSVASTAFGAWLVVDKIGVMEAGLLDGSATGVEVYGGQSWVVLGGAFVTAGLIGLVAALSLAVVRTLMPQPPVEVVEPIDWSAQGDADTDRLGYDADLDYDAAEAAQDRTASESEIDADEVAEPAPTR